MRVRSSDGEVADLAVSNRRNRWAHMRQLLGRYEWVELEALDAKKRVVGALRRDDGDADDGDDVSDSADDGLTVREAELIRLMTNAQKLALDAQRDLMRPMLDANAKLVSMLTERLGVMEELALVHHRRLARELSEDSDGEGKGNPFGSLEAITSMLRLAQMSGITGGGGAPKVVSAPPPSAKPSNGATRPAEKPGG